MGFAVELQGRGAIDPPEFVNREKELRELKALLSGRPNFVYFVYGPINSGKTALLTRVAEELPGSHLVFYINFRRRNVRTVNDLIRVLFKVKRGRVSEETSKIVEDILKAGVKVLKNLKGIPIPESIFDVLFRRTEKVEDIFAFLEEYFEEIKDKGYQPVMILDEMQSVKEVINTTGQTVISGLFNFFIGMTKEKHLCHVLCATSDCLFVEAVYSNARLEGRAKYYLVDDLGREEAFRVYEAFGFEKKELIWNYIGGKIGDILSLFEEKRRGLGEDEALKEMLKSEEGRLEWIKLTKLRDKEDGREVWEFLKLFKETPILSKPRIEEDFDKVLFWIKENVLFYNPIERVVRPQGRLVERAIGELF